MKRPGILFIAAFITICLYNSCKKDDPTNIRNLFTAGPWELASLQVFNYVGTTLDETDTLNTDCDKKQIFRFNDDNTCTYSNYDCLDQAPTGTWSLSRDRLYLLSDILVDTAATDTGSIASGSLRPFTNTKIVNLGQYSMVLQTGDFQETNQPNRARRVVQYSFIRQRNN
ncbi:hypothetical protein LT679_14660 [Mucilaginibacter roseus]|uniref:Lipocalin-like domain-containing protein n=1 Tax=Mucilaginibacter roseus TaxID=1528868 RepID=A0ABS8U6W9_9SPHI|nr:hypothetical protein [Mucilaginibacter roseus]MCD8741855.1 hypothetical protein [Mucilaginibacter roseus]